MEGFKTLEIDNRLHRNEISEIKEISKDEEKLRLLLETNINFKDFISSEYSSANEYYLSKNGKTISYLQNSLGIKGDGIFSKETFFAVIKFQKANNLVVDGLVGNKTQAKLIGEKENDKIQNKYGLSSMFISEPYEKHGNMTYCSRTARKNLYNIGVPQSKVPRGSSAIASMNMYGEKENFANNLSKLPENTNVLDLFIDSTSQYEHRAAAYLSGGEWYVLDPYSKINKNTRKPIPLNNYMASKNIMGAFPYTV